MAGIIGGLHLDPRGLTEVIGVVKACTLSPFSHIFAYILMRNRYHTSWDGQLQNGRPRRVSHSAHEMCLVANHMRRVGTSLQELGREWVLDFLFRLVSTVLTVPRARPPVEGAVVAGEFFSN